MSEELARARSHSLLLFIDVDIDIDAHPWAGAGPYVMKSRQDEIDSRANPGRWNASL